ncbi:hypothetical protein [Micropruina sp.]|uniref:hypothetical protein n=1 Tax=Micropruina sp. TaxID=2737536 RepID=UPI0039E53ECB
MTSAPSPVVDETPTRTRHRDSWSASMFGVAALVVGIVAAVLWRLVVQLPSYTVQPDGSATVTERALTQVFSADAWYVLLGAVFGAAIGIFTWRRFKGLGWLSALLAVGLGALAGVVCWQLGQLLGGASFDERLAIAKPGDSVPIGLTLRSPSALAVWAFAAVTPILLGSALGPDDEAPPRVPRNRRRQALPEPQEVIDELGVVRTDEAGTVRD